MATLREQLEEAKKENLSLRSDIAKLSKINNANKDLRREMESNIGELVKAQQKLHDVEVITNAFIETERTFKQVEVGSHRGVINYETEETETEVVKLLRVIRDATVDKTTSPGYYNPRF